ncbi:pilus assembly protein PilP [Chitinimonas koreensis]|uniref:pilus assembly protein PilP n=1 Tax=Chitinimonas koreensis TaxID=356302 RepID=UPI00048AB9E3|nr:pilus assembly protein PilP [Chitinimonas koreensis]QNM96462.1 pilus assembly protein PilP [Chitinimonas koreensis]
MKKSLLASSLVFFLFGCAGREFDDLKSWMEESTRGMKGKVEPLPEVKPYKPYIYEAFDLVDPFNRSKMEIAKKGGGGLAPNLNRPKESLEAYDLEKLRMVGTLQRGKEISALIQAPDGNLFRVKMGSYMGQNFGMITAITESEITLKEIVEDSSGDWVEKTSTLLLDETESKK